LTFFVNLCSKALPVHFLFFSFGSKLKKDCATTLLSEFYLLIILTKKCVTKFYFMKKIFSLVALTGMLMLMTFNSCNKDNSLTEIDSKSDFKKIGQIHNKGLDYIISKTKISDFITKPNNPFSKNGTTIDTLAVAQHIMEQVNAFLINETLIINGENFDFQELISLDDFFNIYNYSDIGPYTNIPITIKNETVNEINTIINTINPNDIEFSKKISTGELYKFSLNYWDDFDASRILPNNLNRTSKEISFNWLSVGMSDAQGAYGGFAMGGSGGAVAIGLMSSAYNMCIQALWQSL